MFSSSLDIQGCQIKGDSANFSVSTRFEIHKILFAEWYYALPTYLNVGWFGEKMTMGKGKKRKANNWKKDKNGWKTLILREDFEILTQKYLKLSKFWVQGGPKFSLKKNNPQISTLCYGVLTQ